MSRIKDKMDEIKDFLIELENIQPNSFGEYKSNIEKKAACERYIEKIVEAATDLAFLIIKKDKLKIPEDDIDAFNILQDNKTIEQKLAKKLKNAKGMRNIIAHQYGKIDDKIVFESITNELQKDIKKFLKQIKNDISN